jgi:hypothetical protein
MAFSFVDTLGLTGARTLFSSILVHPVVYARHGRELMGCPSFAEYVIVGTFYIPYVNKKYNLDKTIDYKRSGSINVLLLLIWVKMVARYSLPSANLRSDRYVYPA